MLKEEQKIKRLDVLAKSSIADAIELESEFRLARDGMMPNHSLAKTLELMRHVSSFRAVCSIMRDRADLSLLVQGHAEYYLEYMDGIFSVEEVLEIDNAYDALSTLIYKGENV